MSGYDLAEEVAGTYRGMMIAVPKDEWVVFHGMSPQELSPFLKNIVRHGHDGGESASLPSPAQAFKPCSNAERPVPPPMLTMCKGSILNQQDRRLRTAAIRRTQVRRPPSGCAARAERLSANYRGELQALRKRSGLFVVVVNGDRFQVVGFEDLVAIETAEVVDAIPPRQDLSTAVLAGHTER